MSILRQWKTMGISGLRLVMALTAIVGLALPALGDDWLPFRGHADEMRLPIPETGAGDCLRGCQVTASGVGQATYLGQFRRLACGVLQADGSREGIGEFTAANGDTLCADFKVEPPIPGPTGLSIQGTYTFTGGTGRFSDASGGAYFVGVRTVDDAGITHIAVDFVGFIQY